MSIGSRSLSHLLRSVRASVDPVVASLTREADHLITNTCCYSETSLQQVNFRGTAIRLPYDWAVDSILPYHNVSGQVTEHAWLHEWRRTLVNRCALCSVASILVFPEPDLCGVLVFE